MNAIPARTASTAPAGPPPPLSSRVDFTDDSGVTRQTFANARTGAFPAGAASSGFGIDLNGDGTHGGADGYLAFDLDGDGQYTREEVATTNRYLKALNGETDLDGDGNVSFAERSESRNLVQQYGSIDLDGDETVQGWELAEGGFKVVQFQGDGPGRLVELPGFERTAGPQQQVDPHAEQSAEITAHGNQQLDFWSGMLGFDLNAALGQFDFATGGGGGGGMQAPPVQQSFGGFNGFASGGMPQMDPMMMMMMMMGMGGGGFQGGGNPQMFGGVQSSMMMMPQMSFGMPQVPIFAAGF